VPLGLIVLSHDLPSVRRKRRQMALWWAYKSKPGDSPRRDRSEPPAK
jgi:hypothetical protein